MKKKGVSDVLGYILLISFAIFMSFLVYQGLKTYVPVKALECPDGVSIFVQSVSCNLTEGGAPDVGPYDLRLTIKNNGRYNIAGYFIHASNNSNKTVADIPLIDYLTVRQGIVKMTNAIVFQSTTSGNFVNISDQAFAEYKNIPQKIYSLDILPIRFQKEENRLRIVSCGEAIIKEKINCT